MKVYVKFIGDLRRIANVSDIWLSFNENKASLREVFTKLEMEKGIKTDLGNSNIIVLVNGRHIDYLGGLDAELEDLDEIVLTTISGAG